MKKMVHPRPLSGMNDFMEWSHASLDHFGWCSSRKRAVEGSPSSQPSVNFVPSVVQCDPQGNPPSVDNLFSADPYANRFLYTGREFLKEANLDDYRNRVYSASWEDSSRPIPSVLMPGMGIFIGMSLTELPYLLIHWVWRAALVF
jgi:hypothetical protein